MQPAILLVLVCFTIQVISLAAEAPSRFQDVRGNTSVIVRPLSLEGFVEESPGLNPGDLVACSRLRVPGLSRMRDFKKFSHSRRVKVETMSFSAGSFKGFPKVDVCFHRNMTLGLAQCAQDNWRALDKGFWSGVMSPFETKFVDIRICEPHADIPLTVSVDDEYHAYRLIFLLGGLFLLFVAPIVSEWVPFYYTTAMTLGVFLVVLILLYQSMKLLPTGRKSSLYIFLYGSMIGLGTVILHYFSGLVSSILLELGFSDDLYSPIAIFVGVGIALIGAWLGYWGVRKLVIREDGKIDDGTSKFVKWAIRIVGSVMILQSSHDTVFAILAFVVGGAFSWGVMEIRVPYEAFRELLQQEWSSESLTGKVVSFKSGRKGNKADAAKTQLKMLKKVPGNEMLLKLSQLGNYPSPGSQGTSWNNLNDQYVSTFHESPLLRPASLEEFEAASRSYTKKALKELFKSKEFQDWASSQGDRVYITPHESREERLEQEIELTADMEGEEKGGYLFSRYF